MFRSVTSQRLHADNSWDLTVAGPRSAATAAGLERDGTDLVPVAVVLRGMAVILQDFGDGALVNALQTELPLSQLQETSAQRKQGTRGSFPSWSNIHF